jgi:hypothetical protein
MSVAPVTPMSGLALEIGELDRVASRDRWGLALIAVGWSHLAVFLVCQGLFSLHDRASTHYVPLWGLDLASTLLIFRHFIGGASRGPALRRVVVRVWITFLILAFSAAVLNVVVGQETDWFKAIWATLATFGFATMAWILHLGFLIPAVQMSLTALLIARNPDGAYWIYGVSWCLALNGVGLVLHRRRVRARNGSVAPRSPDGALVLPVVDG